MAAETSIGDGDRGLELSSAIAGSGDRGEDTRPSGEPMVAGGLAPSDEDDALVAAATSEAACAACSAAETRPSSAALSRSSACFSATSASHLRSKARASVRETAA